MKNRNAAFKKIRSIWYDITLILACYSLLIGAVIKELI